MAFISADSSSVFDFVVKRGNGVKGLVDSGISEVPNLFIQTPDERIGQKFSNQSSASHLQFASVPIDLSKLDGPEHEKVLEDIVRAAETLGFFQVINHGGDLEMLESVKEAAHRFFTQPPEQKATYLEGVSPTPLVKYKTSFNPKNEEILEWRDSIGMVYTNDVDAQKHWPQECKDEALAYVKLGSNVVKRLSEVLMNILGVKLDDSKLDSLTGFKTLSMNFYPKCPNPELTVGVGRHSDVVMLTVLLQDDIGGLYVRVEEDPQSGMRDEWIEVPPIPGALVVNIGDSLQILSNGRYKSAEHRVRTTNRQSRVSIPFFAGPRPTEKIGPLPEMVEGNGERPLYREVVFQDYLSNFLAKSLNGKQSKLEFAKITYPCD